MSEITKGLQGYLAEDASLMEEITYEEFEGKKVTPGNSDESINDAYQVYQKYCARLQKV